MKRPFLFLICGGLLFMACNSSRKSGKTEKQQQAEVETVSERSSDPEPANENPIADPNDPAVMPGETLGAFAEDMEIGSPQGALGNFIADALLEFGKEHVDGEAVMALVHNSCVAGQAYQGPFDMLSLESMFEKEERVTSLVLSGQEMEILGGMIAERIKRGNPAEAWAISGATLQISKEGSTSFMISGDKIDPKKEYTVITTGYIVNDPSCLGTPETAWKEYASKFRLKQAIVWFFEQQESPVPAVIDNRIMVSY